jgi:tellurite resistance protein
MIPASFFRMPLGLLALGIAWQSAAGIRPVPLQIGEVLIWAAALLWAFLFIAYLAKWVWQQVAAEAEFEHPVQCCFVGLAGVVASLASIGLASQIRGLSFGLLIPGCRMDTCLRHLPHRSLMDGRTQTGDHHAHPLHSYCCRKLDHKTSAATLGYADWGQLAFGAGVFAWLAIESVLLHRLYTATSLPPALRPTLGIQLAPPTVAAVAYLNVGSGAPDTFAHALVGYALLRALILIRFWPWLREAGPTLAW